MTEMTHYLNIHQGPTDTERMCLCVGLCGCVCFVCVLMKTLLIITLSLISLSSATFVVVVVVGFLCPLKQHSPSFF